MTRDLTIIGLALASVAGLAAAIWLDSNALAAIAGAPLGLVFHVAFKR